MKNSKTVFQDFIANITLKESNDEIKSIAHLVFAKILRLDRTDILAAKPFTLYPEQEKELYAIAQRINKHEPIQYILGEAEFFGRMFKVTSAVLIPRPETEYLINEILHYANLHKNHAPKILDIGTGSGCIPVTLKKELPEASVFATDISADALAIAKENAMMLNAGIDFFQHDILTQDIPVGSLDVVVSNPPYIAQTEEALMNKNVLQFEPHLALFVPDDDALKFYKAIAEKAREVLTVGGLLITEINERFGNETAAIFKANHFQDVAIIKDLDGKDRIVKGIV
jgi:release factor glutamine methyltransferase